MYIRNNYVKRDVYVTQDQLHLLPLQLLVPHLGAPAVDLLDSEVVQVALLVEALSAPQVQEEESIEDVTSLHPLEQIVRIVVQVEPPTITV